MGRGRQTGKRVEIHQERQPGRRIQADSLPHSPSMPVCGFHADTTADPTPQPCWRTNPDVVDVTGLKSSREYEPCLLEMTEAHCTIASLGKPFRYIVGIMAKKVLGERRERGMRLWDDFKAHLPEMGCLLYTSPSPRDRTRSRMPSSA